MVEFYRTLRTVELHGDELSELRGRLLAVPRDLPHELAGLIEFQLGIVSAAQALAGGVNEELIRSRVRAGAWQRVHRGVYATFSGDLSRDAQLWAAVLSAGRGAVLSHRSAAELYRLTDEPSAVTHVTVPAERRVLAPAGVVIHRSSRLAQATHPSLAPPRTRLEDTILDMVDSAQTVEDAIGWITRGLGRRLTVTSKLDAAARQRSRIRWRQELGEVLSPDLIGVLSVLEYRYVRHVERPHGLPPRERQFRFRQDGRSGYRDTLYAEYGVAVELDGQLAHPAERRWRDVRRDNIAVGWGIATLRFGWWDVTGQPCEVAAQVATALVGRGYYGVRGCSPECPVTGIAAQAKGAARGGA
jgi:hypothetical protein